MIFRNPRQRWLRGLLSLFAILVMVSPTLCVALLVQVQANPSAPATQTINHAEPIAPGQEISIEVQSKKIYRFQFHMEAGQYAQFIFHHYSNLSALITTPDGRRVPQSYMEGGIRLSSGIFSGEAGILAPKTSDYFLEVEAGRTRLSRYRVRFQILRFPTHDDHKRLVAFTRYLKVLALHQQRKAEAYLEATRVGIQTVPLWHELGDQALAARTLYYVGESFVSISRYAEALEYFDQALDAARAASESWIQADILVSKGQTFQYLSEYQKALACYEQAWTFVNDDNDHALTVRAWALDNFGVAYNSLGEKQKALTYHQQAYELYKDVEVRGQAHALTHQAEVLMALGEKQQAMENLERALPLWESVPDRWGSARVYHRLGNLYFSLGDAAQALAYYQMALPIWQEVGDQDAETETLNGLGKVHNALGENQKALNDLQQALRVRQRNAPTHSNREGKAYTLTHIGATVYAMGDYAEAREMYLQALEIWRNIGNPNGEAFTLNDLGDAAYASQKQAEALTYYQQALALHRRLLNREGEANALYGMARLASDQGNLKQARTDIEEAIKLVEEVRIRLATQDLRVSYQAAVQDYYELYIEVLMRLHRVKPTGTEAALACQISEQARARSLLEMLTLSGADIREGIPPALREKARSLLRDLNDKVDYRTRLHTRLYTTEEERVAALEVTRAAHAYEEVQKLIQAGNSRYTALMQPRPLTVSQMQSQLLDHNTMILEYALGRQHSYLWAISDTALMSYELPNRQVIEQAARQLHGLLSERARSIKDETSEQRRARINRADRETAAAASRLSKLILAPVAGELGDKRLLIVADGALQFIPFAALPEPSRSSSGASMIADAKAASNLERRVLRPIEDNDLPLLVHHEIIMLPSASVLAVLRQETSGRKIAPKALAVLADPVFSKDDERVLAIAGKPLNKAAAEAPSEGHKSLRDLQRALADVNEGNAAQPIRRLMASRFEANRITSFVAPAQRFKALDFQASRETAISAALTDYRVIHFASHAIIDTVNPGLSGIVLSLVDRQGRQRDGFLRATEIYNLKFPAELVVLSACRTGLGKEVRGEGLIGLTRGFMYAGALRVMASLWSVDDQTSADLMARVYQAMLGNQHLSPAAALRSAQLEMWKSRRWPSPYYWAGFILQGEWK